jgi:hypothetical protein
MTFAAEEAGEILSQDARGRVLVSRERRESLLEEYDRIVMNPACQLPKFFEAQPTADLQMKRAVWSAPVPRADSSSS